jgi:hypothetical protein
VLRKQAERQRALATHLGRGGAQRHVVQRVEGAAVCPRQRRQRARVGRRADVARELTRCLIR